MRERATLISGRNEAGCARDEVGATITVERASRSPAGARRRSGALVRETRVRLHQVRFRARVLPAYANQCTVCRLKEPRLLDAAHIVSDADAAGEATVPNGLSLCSIHHRAFDEDLVGVSPDYEVRVHPRLLDDEDGPMLDLLKGAHRKAIVLPRRQASRPSRELLAVRYEQFVAAT